MKWVAALPAISGLLSACATSAVGSGAPPLIVVNKPADQVVVAKAVSYRQRPEGGFTLLGYDFLAEFALSTAEASHHDGVAELVTPKGERLPFREGGHGVSATGLNHLKSLEDLNARMPNGTYVIRYTRPGLAPFAAIAQLQATEASIPAPLTVRLFQNGHVVDPTSVDPSRPVVVAVQHSSKKPMLIFVHIADCQGHLVARTPNFSGEPELTYQGLSYSLPASTLAAGSGYQLYVEGGTYSLTRTDGVPTFASYPVATFLDFRTSGEGGVPCPTLPYQMDFRQTDRSRP